MYDASQIYGQIYEWFGASLFYAILGIYLLTYFQTFPKERCSEIKSQILSFYCFIVTIMALKADLISH
jgi:hypothetical protein